MLRGVELARSQGVLVVGDEVEVRRPDARRLLVHGSTPSFRWFGCIGTKGRNVGVRRAAIALELECCAQAREELMQLGQRSSPRHHGKQQKG